MYINIIEKYYLFCKERGIEFSVHDNVKSYDRTTLFCSAGMQQFKYLFRDKGVCDRTVSNIQSCLRLLDINSIGDGSHLLYFNMVGLFSFRQMNVYQSIKFWIEFLTSIGVTPDYVTVHPDKYDEWKVWHEMIHNIPIRMDSKCIWTDGKLSGFCTEFYVDNEKFTNLEIGNIVNICGDCIDVGFGLERLDMIVNGQKPQSDILTLKNTIEVILKSGFTPGNILQGYVLRRLMRRLINLDGHMDNKFFVQEKERQKDLLKKYEKLRLKYTNKSKKWWFDTHEIDLELV